LIYQYKVYRVLLDLQDPKEKKGKLEKLVLQEILAKLGLQDLKVKLDLQDHKERKEILEKSGRQDHKD